MTTDNDSPAEAATPETDAAVEEFEYAEVWLDGEIGGGTKEIVDPDFARKLERERDEARKLRDEWCAEYTKARDKLRKIYKLADDYEPNSNSNALANEISALVIGALGNEGVE